MNTAANHITAGRDSRLRVSSIFHKDYQACGYESVLMDGNLDASERVPTGSTYALREVERTNRNAPAPALASREGSGLLRAAVCALALCGSAHAACIDDLRADLDTFKAEAKRVVYVPDAEKIDDLRLVIGTVDEGNNGEYSHRQNLVRVNVRMCAEPKLRRDFVLTHEIGHAIVLALYPDMLEEVNSRIFRNGTQLHEDMANQYASRIYPRANIPALLHLWDEGCAAGYSFQCGHAASWRAGMTR